MAKVNPVKDMGLSNGEKLHEAESQEVVETAPGQERGKWGHQIEFMLTCIGYVVGLGNIWRFPYLVYLHGGGAFLIAYFILNFTVGLGVVLLESAPAQFSGRGPQSVWTCIPFFKGCGLASVMMMFLSSIPFCTVYMWAWYYMFSSFTAVLPWSTCGNDFNTEYCYSRTEALPCEEMNGTFYNMVCYNDSMAAEQNLTEFFNSSLPGLRVTGTQEFFDRKMYHLDLENTISNMGGLKWDLVLTSLFSWTLTFLCIIKSIQSIGKVVYFTATFPYVIIAIMIGRAAVLPGAGKGIDYYLTADWNRLASFATWADAAGQILFSVAVGFGGMMTFCSYSDFRNNLVRDSLIIVTINGFTSFFAGFAVFAILGFMAEDLNVEISDVANAESGLAFITYPEVVSRMPLSPLWSVLFFLMLVMVALDSVITGVEVLQTGILDAFPRLRKHKMFIALGLCIFLFFFTLPECTMGGYFLEELINWYVVTFTLVITVFFEVVALAWFYGPFRMSDDIAVMLGHPRWWRRVRWVWIILWTVVCPIVLAVVFVATCIFFIPLEFGTGPLPEWATVIGWLSGLCTLIAFPIGAVHAVYKSYQDDDFTGNFGQRLLHLFKPGKEWGPRQDQPESTKGLIDLPLPISYDNPAFAHSTKF